MKQKTTQTAAHPITRFKRLVATAILLATSSIPISAAAPSAPLPPKTLARQLDALQADIETYRLEKHIAGLALAIVKDDKVILSKGFGNARLEPLTPVTEKTAFIIGSSTKSFTATLAAMLVEDGAVSWETPTEELLPELELKIKSDDPDARVTLEDLLSHRTGFPRMSLLWVTPQTDADTIFQTASLATPLRPFRKTLNYNNVLYAAGAVSAANAAESDWATLMQKRLFKPLKMRSTYPSVAAGKEDKRFAHGFRWDAEKQQLLKTELLEGVDNIAPSGAIVSNLQDMSKWIRFLLAEGRVGKKQLIQKASLEDTWTPRVNLSPEMGYGLGWFVESWQGKKVVHHGGNIKGYACQVALIPEENLGLVLMANVTMTPLQSQILSMTWKSVLTKIPPEPTAPAASPIIDYTPFIGDFVANFGPFSNTLFTVKENEGALAINVPGQMLYNLKPPAEDGKWYFEITDKIAISFDPQSNGQAPSLKMYQAGMTFELPRKSDDEPSDPILSREALRALMQHDAQLEALSQLGNIEITGKMKLPQTGIEGSLKIYLSKTNDQIRVESDFGQFGNTQSVYSNGRGENRASFNPAETMNTQMIEELKIDQGFINLFDHFKNIEVLKKETVNETPLYEVQFSGPDQTPLKALVHQETGRVMRVRATRLFDPEVPAMPLQVSYHNFKDIQGYNLPHRIVVSDNESGSRIMIFQKVEIVDSFDSALFALETD